MGRFTDIQDAEPRQAAESAPGGAGIGPAGRPLASNLRLPCAFVLTRICSPDLANAWPQL
jgi:hypothetical protein